MARLSPSAMRAISASSVVSRTGALTCCDAISRRMCWFCMTIPRSQARGLSTRGLLPGYCAGRGKWFRRGADLFLGVSRLFRASRACFWEIFRRLGFRSAIVGVYGAHPVGTEGQVAGLMEVLHDDEDMPRDPGPAWARCPLGPLGPRALRSGRPRADGRSRRAL